MPQPENECVHGIDLQRDCRECDEESHNRQLEREARAMSDNVDEEEDEFDYEESFEEEEDDFEDDEELADEDFVDPVDPDEKHGTTNA